LLGSLRTDSVTSAIPALSLKAKTNRYQPADVIACVPEQEPGEPLPKLIKNSPDLSWSCL